MRAVDALVAWFHEQLNEDERRARAATFAPWRVGKVEGGSATVVAQFSLEGGRDQDVIPEDVDYGTVVELEDCEHVVRYDPVWAVARIEIMRGILALYETNRRLSEENAQTLVQMGRSPRWTDPSWGARVGQLRTFGWELEGRVKALAAVIQQQAVEYAGRPGYQKEWRP